MPFVSVIVPIYKVDQYLRQCVDSILHQTFSDIEVILVDDGSPDDCPSICDDYAVEDERVRVIHQANRGLSKARNAGLEISRGEFVMFVDSDDYWMGDDSLEKLVRVVKRDQADVTLFRCMKYYQARSELVLPRREFDLEVFGHAEKNEVLIELVKTGVFPAAAWDKIIRRAVLIDNSIFFEDGILSEDVDWFLELFISSNEITATNLDFYVYRQQREGAITSSISMKSVNDLFWIVRKWAARLGNLDEDPILRDGLLSFLAHQYTILMGHAIGLKGPEGRLLRKSIKRYDWLLRYDMNSKVRATRWLYRLVGFTLTSKVLSLALYLRDRGIIKS